MTALYLDVHVPAALAEQLRRRGVDVLTAQEDGAAELDGADLLDRSAELCRLLFTQDMRLAGLAEDWQYTDRKFAGLVLCHPLRGSVGQYVRDLDFIAKNTCQSEWIGQLEQLPIR
jgi:hypothetical protein